MSTGARGNRFNLHVQHKTRTSYEVSLKQCQTIAKKLSKAVEDLSLLDVLDHYQVQVASSCGGMGTCGTCKVKFDRGSKVPELTPLEIEFRAERGIFHRDQSIDRQSCQIEILPALGGSDWSIIVEPSKINEP